MSHGSLEPLQESAEVSALESPVRIDIITKEGHGRVAGREEKATLFSPRQPGTKLAASARMEGPQHGRELASERVRTLFLHLGMDCPKPLVLQHFSPTNELFPNFRFLRDAAQQGSCWL